ncbi:MAG: ATP synthase F0 subunit C [Planctomycetota bacterium]
MLAVVVIAPAALAEVTYQAQSAEEAADIASSTYSGIASMGKGLGMGLVILGAGLGIGKIGSSALESIARQPESTGPIGTNMIIAAALVEGVTVIALAFMLAI